MPPGLPRASGKRFHWRGSQKAAPDLEDATRARVNFFMNRFRKMGLIDYNGDLEIHSSLLDVILRDEPGVTGSAPPE
jgi:CRP/FNR family cyclic AMP-dependent transcriptional regulator